MEKAYKQALNSLNPEQKRAVKNTEGPMMVIAGPGTGKTQLLSSRVAYILKNTDTKANNVLCLTYTNKAAVNMKDRIIQLTGREGARVPASTFHSFAGEIMNLYPDYFWQAAKLAIAPDATQLDIIESIASKLPLNNPLAQKFAGQYTLLKEIKSAITLAKEAGLGPEKLQAIIEFNLRFIDKIETKLAKILGSRLSVTKLPALAAEVEGLAPQLVKLDYYPLKSLSDVISSSLSEAISQDGETNNCRQTSKWKSRWLQTVDGRTAMFNERRRNEWWLNLAGFYKSYQEELYRRGFYDYADMIIETTSRLEAMPELLADIQERFNYVLVDEFQDSTPAQARLAHLIADHYSSEGKPNLMVVGDDDQTIFRFNGAEVNNLLGFEERYPDAAKVVLKTNYRSPQKVLDTAEAVIGQAESRIVNIDKSLGKKLVSVKSQPAVISATAYSSEEAQLSQVGRDIKTSYKPKTSIAVLARSHASLIKMASILQQLKVPVSYEQSANILDNEIVSQVYYIAKILLAIQSGDKQQVNGLLHRVVRWEAWGFSPKSLWLLASTNLGKDWLDRMLESRDNNLGDFGRWLLYLAKEADNQPLAVTVEQILGLRESGNFTSPVREFLISKTTSQTGRYFYGLSAVQLLRSRVNEFASNRQPGLDDLVRFIDVNRNNKVIIADESPYVTGEKAVNLLTVHKAKGLEFDDVYIIDAIQDNWRPKSGGRKPPANLPLQPVLEDMDDYIRLMYVAVTRARSKLAISGYWQDHSGKEVSLSPIVQSVLEFKKAQQLPKQILAASLEENMRWPDLSKGDKKGILKSRLQNFNLNVTQLLDFIDVANHGPQDFMERHLLKLPDVKSSSQSFGTAIHAALSQAQLQANRGRLNLPKVVSEFEKALAHENLPKIEHDRQLNKGRQLIDRLFKQFGFKLPKDGLPEQKIQSVRLGTAFLSGTLDRLDRTPKSILVTDYKTGSPVPSLETNNKSQQLKAHKHKIQLTFYALLLEARGLPANQAISGQMVYLEADQQKNLTKYYTPTRGDKQLLTELIEAVWRKIQAVDMPDISKYTPDYTGVLEFQKDLIQGR